LMEFQPERFVVEMEKADKNQFKKSLVLRNLFLTSTILKNQKH